MLNTREPHARLHTETPASLCVRRHVEDCAQVSNLLGGVSPDDDMVKNHVLPKLQKEDVMLDFVHIDERIDAGGVANGTALTTASDGLTLINQVRAGLLTRGL